MKKMPLSWFLFRSFFKHSSPILSLFDKRLIRKYARFPRKNIPVFIIGAPRTGSTLLYEFITNYFDVLYINNFINLIYENLNVGFHLNHLFIANKPHNYFKSLHGKTFQGGFNAPHEGGAFWYRWIPKGVDHISEKDAEELDFQDIRDNIFAVINRFNSPFLFKNMNAGMRLSLIHKVCQESKFIYITRDPVYVTQSIIKVREQIFNDKNIWWSIKPPNYKELISLPYIEQIVKQVYFIEKQISFDLKKYFSESDVLNINYNELADTHELFDKIHRFIPNIKGKKHDALETFKLNNSQTVDDETYKKIQETVLNVYGKNDKG